jgi:hypothetical protein
VNVLWGIVMKAIGVLFVYWGVQSRVSSGTASLPLVRGSYGASGSIASTRSSEQFWSSSDFSGRSESSGDSLLNGDHQIRRAIDRLDPEISHGAVLLKEAGYAVVPSLQFGRR